MFLLYGLGKRNLATDEHRWTPIKQKLLSYRCSSVASRFLPCNDILSGEEFAMSRQSWIAIWRSIAIVSALTVLPRGSLEHLLPSASRCCNLNVDKRRPRWARWFRKWACGLGFPASGKAGLSRSRSRHDILSAVEPSEPDTASPSENEPMLYCPVCSVRLEQRKCKLFCPQCGYYMSCADYY